MGCVVNGRGKAKEADIGVIFKKGQIIKTVPEDKIFSELLIEINKI